MTKLCGFTIATAIVLTRAPPFRPTKLARLGCRPANGRAGGSSIAAATELSSIAPTPVIPKEVGGNDTDGSNCHARTTQTSGGV